MATEARSLVLAVGFIGAALVFSCGGKVEVGSYPATDAGTGGSSAKGGAAGKGGWSGQGGSGWGGQGQGGSGWGGQGQGGSGWGGQGQGGQGTGGQGWGGQGQGGQSYGGAGGSYYGMITTIKFSTPFLLDSDKLYDDNYVQQHSDAVLYDAAFFGYYGMTSKPVPASSGQVLAYGVHSAASAGYPPTIQIAQYSYNQQSQILNPLVEFYFASDKVEVGPLEVGFSPSGGAYLILYNEINNGNDYCALAVASGVVQIAEAVNTSQPDGGKLTFYGSSLPLYYPTDTPWGNVSQYLGSVCPKE